MDSILDALPDDRTVTWGESTFEIRKLLPTEAKPLFIRHVRPLLRGALSAETGGGGETEGWRIMLAAFTDAPSEHYEAISTSMARCITVTRGTEKRVLAGHEPWAFQGLEGAHMVMLDVRAFTVNFRDWFAVAMQELPSLAQAFASLVPETSTPSSDTSSPPDTAASPISRPAAVTAIR